MMNTVFWLVFIFSSLSVAKSTLISNATVFTGEILKTNEDDTVLVRVFKRLFEQEAVKIPSIVSLQNSEKDESLNAAKGVYIFYAVPLDNNKFELLHYWGVKKEDFDGISPSSLEEIQQHSHHRLRRSVDVCSRTLQCRYGGKCGQLSTGKATCFCPIKCSKKDNAPVCGKDRVTYHNLCTVQRYSCIRQRTIEIEHYGPCMVSSCKEALQEELGNKDGEYSMLLNPKCQRPVKVYCHDMHTSEPTEYLTLTQGRDNHARIYERRLPRAIRDQCGGLNPGNVPYVDGGYTRFYKVRFDVRGSKIIPNDFKFASSAGKAITFGTAGDCYSANLGNCRKGSFSIDLIGTGMRLQSSVRWSVQARPAGIQMQDFQMTNQSQVVSAKCGGNCGKCNPAGDILVEQLHCGACDGVSCDYHGTCQYEPLSFKGYRCACPNCTSERRAHTDKVCGSDHVTYESECFMNKNSCLKKIKITIAYKGPCNPCNNVTCENYGVCKRDRNSLKGYRCECQECTSSEETDYVCGDDRRTYRNTCELKLASCRRKRLITISYLGRCDPCRGVNCANYGVCKPNPRALLGYQCECLTQCPPDISKVCGSDGRTYTSECALKRASCQRRITIAISYRGSCDPCEDKQCFFNSTCIKGSDNRARCVCPECSGEAVNYICASDGNSYVNLCSAKRQACLRKFFLQFVHNGKCNPCKDKKCSFNSQCVVDRNFRASCQCPKCPPKTKRVCGNDGKTYINECELRKQSCKTKTNIKVLHEGKCNPCEDVRCSFNAQCVVDSDYKASCQCPKCPPKTKRVCGNDGKTYINECELRKQSCRTKTNIKVLHEGKCNPCEDKKCPINAQCVVDRNFRASCQCPKCPPKTKRVCGSDEKTYINECELRKQSCTTKTNIKVLHEGKCNPCEDVRCSFNAQCVVDSDYKASCQCPKCPPKTKRVCGNNGKTYINECELRKQSCTTKTNIKVLHEGKCNPCEDVRCSFNAQCVVDSDYKASCQCPKCPPKTKRVCGSDGKTYINECELRMRSCTTKTNIKVLHEGKCNPCEDKKCPINAQCVVDSDYKASCQCPKCPPKTKRVCGSDGKTYVNECELRKQSCTTKTNIKVLHEGKCNPCEDKKCPINAQCVVDRNFRASCQCPKCPPKTKRVCGSDGKTYINECELRKQSCTTKTNIKVLHEGKCNPCEDVRCSFNAQCVVDSDYKASCQCPKCPPKTKRVCGNDGKTYINECELRKQSCTTKTNIKVLHEGKCNPCEDKKCPINAQCVVDNDYTASCQCPKCPPKTKRVCGSDGKTYINECELRKQSCTTKTNIRVLHEGKCNPCDDKECPINAQCVVDSDYKASCQCPKCPPKTKRVCGSDGKTYINECELRKQSCTTKTNIKVLHEGKCNPCDEKHCSNNAQCVVDSDYKASCQCPKCPPKTKRVCGNDGKTYINECELRKQSCTTKTSIKVLHEGKCNPCEDKKCPINAQCVVDSDYKASCQCPKCPPETKRVCGSDGKTYINECELRKQSCTTKTNIKVLHEGKCDPCKDKKCYYNSTCVEGNDNKGYCVCPQCSDEPVDYVCASDGNTYPNECQERRTACMTKSLLKTIHKGKCDPCEDKNCSFNAQCVVNKNYKASCKCPKCPPETKHVCGSDGKTYINECELRKQSCTTKTNIRVLHEGKCNPCEDKICYYNSTCTKGNDNKGYCICKQCSDEPIEYVCASDGNTYPNECQARKKACMTRSPLKTIHKGKCDPCQDVKCFFNAQCVVDSDYKASCQCPKCPPKTKRVCGSDGKTYINECELRKQSCRTKTNIGVLHEGKCDPCEDKKCSYNSTCTKGKDHKAYCVCPQCSNEPVEYVCASDRKTYPNECQAKKTACMTRSLLKTVHKGKCDPCEGVKCKNYGVCKGDPQSEKGYQCVCRECLNVGTPVCGSNRRTYKSECFLKRTSCRKNKYLYVTHVGPCDPCKTTKCHHGATCVIGRDYKAYCQCPQCSNTTENPVCGSDGKTYPSECEVRRISCMTALPIAVVKQGKCDECNCPPYAECQRDEQATKGFKCVCPSTSSEDQSTVCGSDGRTYTNRKVLQRESCLTEVKIDILYSGTCSPCRGRECSHHAECVARGDQGICQCPQRCPDNIKPRIVCASDGNTYDNECQLRRASCLQQRPLEVKHNGPCTECKCPPYAQCRRDEDNFKKYKCVCPSSSSTDQSEVCGSDGRTYVNKQVLERESCVTDIKITVLYAGVCIPCRGRECSHHAECVARGDQGICQCPQRCPDNIKPRIVCGSDGNTYDNDCQLRRASCLQQRPLEVKHNGPCTECKCPPYAQCRRDEDNFKKYKCVCPSSSSTDQSEVCGSDGRTYVNRQVLERKSCVTDIKIAIIYAGVCIPCRGRECSHHAECVARGDQGICQCPQRCPDNIKPRIVCGSDGNTYDNECQLRRASCLQQRPLEVKHDGPCNVCHNNTCAYYSRCVPTSKRSYSCVCPREYYSRVSKVCGSDGRTYRNEMTLQQESCLRQVSIEVIHKGVCGPCRGRECDFNAVCVATPNGNALCRCPKQCFTIPKPVCGSDGQTYEDECEMKRASCIKREPITAVRPGECPTAPEEDVDIIYALGSIARNHVPLFEIEKNITRAIIQQQNSPQTRHGLIVFGKDPKEVSPLENFKSEPELVEKLMDLKWPSEAKSLAPPLNKGTQVFKEQGRPGSRRFLVIFITGQLDRTSDDLKKAARKIHDSGGKIVAYKLSDLPRDEEFVRVIPQDQILKVDAKDDPWRLAMLFHFQTRKAPCQILNCQNYAICRSSASQQARCECPTCPKREDPVCGSDRKTYSSECELRRVSCLAGRPLAVKHTGKCAKKQDESTVFVMGSSGPNAEKVFTHQKEIVKEFVNNQTNPDAKFTVVTYGPSTTRTWKLDEPNKQKRNKIINSVSWNGRGTRLDLGLSEAYNVLKRTKPNTQKRVYIFVSQEADVGSEPVKKIIGKLLEDGTELITIQIVDRDDPGKEKKIVPRTKFVVKIHARDDPKKLAQLLIVTFYTDPCMRLKCSKYFGSCVVSLHSVPECKCLHDCDYVDEPVCGKDKNTYFSECALMKDSCIREVPNSVSHGGQCKHCGNLNCPPYSKCMLSSSGEPYCACREVSKCPREYKRFCDKDKKAYKNLCVLKAEACEANKTVEITDASYCAPRFFSGDSFLSLRTPVQGDRTELVLYIRPMTDEGVLLYTDSEKSGDFLGLALKDGHLIYRHDVGSGPVELRSDEKLNLNHWHKIRVSRRGNRAVVSVDTTIARSRRSVTSSYILNVDNRLYLGGINVRKERLTKNLGVSASYQGCLKDLVLNNEQYDLLFPGKHILRQRNVRSCPDNPCLQRPCQNGGKCQFLGESYRCLCPRGFVGRRCQGRDRAVYMRGENSYLAVPAVTKRWLFSLSMEIRPKERDAVIFYASARRYGEDCLILDLNDGRLELRLNVGTGLNIFRTSRRLSLHNWHKVAVTRDSNGVSLVVDDEIIHMTSRPESLGVRLRGNMTFGAVTDPLDRIIVRANTGFQEFTFTGCLKNVILTDYILDLNNLSQDLVDQSGIQTCTSCVGNPCGSYGNCISQSDLTFKCACWENFVTDLCEFREKPLHFNSKDSYISFPLLNGHDDFKLSFEIKPEIRNALVLYMNGKSNMDHFAIAIINGILQLRLNAGGGQFIARFAQPIALFTWHKIEVERNERTVTITLNEDLRAAIVLSKKFTVLDFRGQMFIGSPKTPVGRIIARNKSVENISNLLVVSEDFT
ncbi:uncharacterized protein LOC114518524 isoform X7 [Dendronephthya gigantea]|uniref:uncharacterized protein LOC114518524 isoform X7 n=1 Tax=Dendronephthya gigantea TaxID=151771 RepID=UPI00106BE748|nr:uncharacterized protein LOC114518524 isoform X7 [Dendronephthya gigantea]